MNTPESFWILKKHPLTTGPLPKAKRGRKKGKRNSLDATNKTRALGEKQVPKDIDFPPLEHNGPSISIGLLPFSCFDLSDKTTKT